MATTRATSEYVWLCNRRATSYAIGRGFPRLAAAQRYSLGEARRSLQWFDDCYGVLANKHQISGLVEVVIGPLLIGANRWRDARAIYGKQLWRIPVRELVTTWKAARQRLR